MNFIIEFIVPLSETEVLKAFATVFISCSNRFYLNFVWTFKVKYLEFKDFAKKTIEILSIAEVMCDYYFEAVFKLISSIQTFHSNT